MTFQPCARPPRLSIALISAAGLGYEVLLMRLFSVIQWHHFAYMIISLALLGYGASGTFLAFARHRLLRHFPTAFFLNLALFGVSSVACYFLAQKIPFNPQEVLWDARQPLMLFGIYLLLALPFFFVANSIGLALTGYRKETSKIYAADLIGAGGGALGIILLLFWVFPMKALLILGVLGLLAAVASLWELGWRRKGWALAMAAMALLPLLLPGHWPQPNLSPYKALSQTLRVSGTQIVEERSSPLGWVAVVESSRVPFRHAPGLSLNARTVPPRQKGLFTDGGSMSAVTRFTGDPDPLAYLDQMTSALGYHVVPVRRAAVLGAGGGSGVLQALYHEIDSIDAVELNPQVVDLIRNDLAEFSGHLYDRDPVRVHVAEARGFMTREHFSFDLVQLTLLDSFSGSSAGLYALSESYLYTTEALEDYWKRLTPNGVLSISRWVKVPPRDALKMFATGVEALERSGVVAPGRHLVLIRSWQTSTLLIKKSPFTERELERVRTFCRERSFDLGYYPGMTRGEANRFNVLPEPYFFEGAAALLKSDRENFFERYKFELRPATDDRPYFFHFFKWEVLPEIFALRWKGGAALLEMGYLILVATLIQAVAASVVLILLPLWFYRREKIFEKNPLRRSRILVYFLALGLGFLFVEIAFIQKFIQFLHHPLYAVSVVLASFLVFAGLGSAFSQRLRETRGSLAGIRRTVAGLVVLAGLYLVILDPLFSAALQWPGPARVLFSLALIAPVAFCMGIPFPLGLARVADCSPDLVPWVWGVNGCASVISAVLATLLAIHFGFTAVVILALILYGIAAWVFP